MENITALPEKTPERKLWHDGPNYTADAVIVNPGNQEVLLIQRKDTGQWALPGGFIDKDEIALVAARREVFEETGLKVEPGDKPMIYRGIVEDPRNSPTAWIETTAYLFVVNVTSEATPGDDAREAKWIALNQLPELYGSHQQILENALPLISREV